MHAVFIAVAIDDFDQAKAFLQEKVVPQAKQAPGFIRGTWMNLEREKGRGIMVFESEEAAQNVANMLGQVEEGSITVESVEVGEVDASA